MAPAPYIAPPPVGDAVDTPADTQIVDVGILDVGPSPTDDTTKPVGDVVENPDAGESNDGEFPPEDATDTVEPPVPDGIEDVGEPTVDVPPVEDSIDLDIEEDPTNCSTHSDCPGLQLCSVFNLCEEPPICLSDVDCLEDRVCSRSECADVPFGCKSDLECPGGYCNPTSEKCLNTYPCVDQSGCADGVCSDGTFCVECLTADDCPNPLYHACEFSLCTEPDTCAWDGACLNGNGCVEGVCAEKAVPPDLYEPNNSMEDAKVYAAPLTEGLTLHSSDEDWYRIQVGPLIGVLVRVNFDDTHGDLDLHLYDFETGTLINQDTREHPFALVGAGKSLIAKVYYLAVTHEAGVIPSYDLTFFESPKALCVNDSFDQENSTDTIAHAPILDGQKVYLEGLMCCPDDTDWYKIVNGADFSLTAAVVYPVTISGNLKMTLVNEAGQTDEIVLGQGGSLVLEQGLLDAGTWYFGVSGSTAAVQTSYTLDVTVEDVGGCQPDLYEPNDTYDVAPGINSGGPYGLVLCPDEEDWFAVNVPVGFTFTGYFSYPESGSELQMELYRDDGETLEDTGVLPEDDGGTAGTVVHSQSLYEDQTFLLRLHRLSTTAPLAASPYELTIDVKPIPCVEEEGEDNGNAEVATQLPIGMASMDGSFCPPDHSDWYAVTLFPGENMVLDLQYNGEKGKLLLNLYDPMGVTLLAIGLPVASSGSVMNLQVPEWWMPGVYKIMITGDYQGPYTLNLQTAIPALCLVEDLSVEPNNTLLTGIPSMLDESVELALCPGDPDVAYWIGVPDEAYNIVVEAENPGEWLYVDVFSPFGKLVIDTKITESPTTLVFPSTELFSEGAFFLKAQSDVPQVLTITTTVLETE